MATIQQDKDGNWLVLDGVTLIEKFDNREAAAALARFYDYVQSYRLAIVDMIELRNRLTAIREQWDALDYLNTKTDADLDAFRFTKTDMSNALTTCEQFTNLFTPGVRTVLHKIVE